MKFELVATGLLLTGLGAGMLVLSASRQTYLKLLDQRNEDRFPPISVRLLQAVAGIIITWFGVSLTIRAFQ